MASTITAGTWNEAGVAWSPVSSDATGRQNLLQMANVYALSNSGSAGELVEYLSTHHGHIIAGFAVYTSGSSWSTDQRIIGFTNGTTNGTQQCDVQLKAVLWPTAAATASSLRFSICSSPTFAALTTTTTRDFYVSAPREAGSFRDDGAFTTFA
jgi:hypothetical protein